MKNILKQVILEQKNTQKQSTVLRNLPESLENNNEILVISGVRRCGKSVLLNQIRSRRKEQDYFLNFDDERLIRFTVDDFQTLHETFIELFGEQKTFYFDEIQNVPQWERFVRRLYDSGFKVFVTGSNATMLSREMGTHLTGRYCSFELYPFSFSEFLLFNNLKNTEQDFFTTSGRAKLKTNFKTYFEFGGFPIYLQNQSDLFLKSLYESILYRDVMVRNNLTHEREIIELVNYLAGNVSRLFTYNSLAKIIGLKNATTIKNYIDYIQNTYLIFQVSRFDYSIKKQIQNSKKIYFIDNAIVRKFGFSFSDNSGHLLENLVFLELKRRGFEIFYHSQKYECDFIIRTGNQITKAIQVSYVLDNEKTKDREIQGLKEAMDIYKLETGFIITYDTEQEIKIEDKTIQIVPVWKWLLKTDVF